MIESLKIDIVYYGTPSDFEFEFNLGGCCRNARILNTKTTSQKEMVSALAKAVSRSRIIIVTGSLYGEANAVNTVARAISKNTAEVDRKRFSIKSSTEAVAIEGSLPLVTSDGTYGGCIIESGPQSIIVLSENKSIRNDIAEQLIYHYITSISRTPAENSMLDTVAEPTAATPAAPETEVPDTLIEIPKAPDIELPADANTEELSEQSKEAEIAVPVADEPEIILPEPNNEAVSEYDSLMFDNSSILIPDEDDTSDEPEIIPVIESVTAPYYTETENENEEEDPIVVESATAEEAGIDYSLMFNDYETPSLKRKKRISGLTLSLIILFAVLLAVVGLIVYFAVYLPMQQGINPVEYVSDLFDSLFI